jgi:hypothetical protein
LPVHWDTVHKNDNFPVMCFFLIVTQSAAHRELRVTPSTGNGSCCL